MTVEEAHDRVNAIVDLVKLPTARAALEHVLASESAPTAHHSVRSFLFAERLAAHRSLGPDDYDRESLFYATLLHDLGLSSEGDKRVDRFEVAGADLAAEFLDGQGVASDKIEVVWEAIALHTSVGIAPRRGVVCALCEAGIQLDFGRDSEFLSQNDADEVHGNWPRLDGAGTTLASEIIAQGQALPSKAPLTSLADYLTRAAQGITSPLPRGRWGD